MADYQGNDNTCVVCFKNVLYYSIGECDHPVCFECSTRMRVLCLQNECPICRASLAKVVFTDTVKPYKELHNQVYVDKLFERQFKIVYSSEEIKKAYDKLLENCCRLCPKLPPFRSFSGLSDHMRKVHERYYCDLCVKHLKIFTSERKCYTRQELAHHRRKGDLDDTSHRGHPLCEFCEERFMDADELYRHLRKEHLYCHLCDADGRNHYYASHDALAQHFRTDHFLCEEGECSGQHLTAVFRSEIDLKAHKASVHGKGLARAAARQARTLELQFNITPHPVAQQRQGHRGASERESYRDRERDSYRERDNYRERDGHRDRESYRERERDLAPSPVQVAAPRIDTRSDQEFPQLSAAAPAPLLPSAHPNRAYSRGPEALARTDRNFPSLCGGKPAPAPPAAPPRAPVSATLRSSKPSLSIQLQSQPASASNFRLTHPTGTRVTAPPPQQRKPALFDDDFPSLGVARDDHPSLGTGTVQPPKVTMINSQEMQALKKNQTSQQVKKPQLSNSEAFPALSSSSTPTATPQWIKVSKSKEKAKQSKPEPPPPQPKEPKFNQVADFPTLPINNAKAKPKKPTPPPQPPEASKPISKKEKKKQNGEIKKENATKPNYVSVTTNGNDSATVLSYVNNNQSASVGVDDKKIKTISENQASNKKNGGGFKMAANDYPPLAGVKEEAKAAPRVTNGGVPPGFTKRPACDGMTFTNSAGQTFPAPLHTYIPPPDFENRNRALVKKFAAALGGTEAVEDFKVASRAFRDNIISASEFYAHCQAAMGSQLEGVFPELVALLPDIAKQQELIVGRKAANHLDMCSTCGQLLAPADSIGHDTAHWPPLSSR